MNALAMTVVLVWQTPDPEPGREPPPPAEAKEASARKQPAPLRDLPDKEARELTNTFRKEWKDSASMADRSRVLEQFAAGRHQLLVKPLAQIVERDKSVVLRCRAAELLSLQPPKQAYPAVLRLLEDAAVRDSPPVLAAVIAGLSRCGYRARDWSRIDSLFEAEYSPERVPVQEAVLDLVTAHAEKQALDLLLRNLDEPIPEDVDSPTNPPAAYWEGRWKAWRAWRSRVQGALFAITGQRFSTAREAKNWLDENPIK